MKMLKKTYVAIETEVLIKILTFSEATVVLVRQRNHFRQAFYCTILSTGNEQLRSKFHT
jgi:hypothetical protein